MSNSGDPQRSPLATLTVAIGIGLLVATLANGAGTYLKRVGLLDSPSYKRYFSEQCLAVEHTIAGGCCVAQSPDRGRTILAQGMGERAASAYLYESAGGELLLKLAKDALVLTFIALSPFFLARTRAVVPAIWTSPALQPLALATAIGFFAAVWHEGGVAAIAGLRPFLFLVVALLGSWSVPGLPVIAMWAAGALVCQVLLLPYEWLRGMPLRFCPDTLRAAGTLVLPNSLGVFAVTTAAFCLAFLHGRSARAAILASALILVIASGSATGLIALLVVAGLLALQNASGTQRALVAAACLALLLLLIPALPALTGRIDVFASVFGANARLGYLVEVWRSAGPFEMFFGHGLGYGANVSANLGASAQRPPDSGIVALFMQIGLLGVAAFYAALAWGIRKHGALRPFFLAVALCSLTLNILELFPLNFLLGLAFAACMTPRPAPQAS